MKFKASLYCIALTMSCLAMACQLETPLDVGESCVDMRYITLESGERCSRSECPEYKGYFNVNHCPLNYICSKDTDNLSFCLKDCRSHKDRVVCEESCIDPGSSSSHCGAKGFCNSDDENDENFKGYACAVGESCYDGRCIEIACEELGRSQCHEKCVDTSSDNSNCGGCGNADEDKCKVNGECNEYVCKRGYYCNDGNCLKNETCPAEQFGCYCQVTDDGLTNCSDSKINNGEFVCIKPTDADTCGATSCSELGYHCPLGQSCINNKCACPEGTFKHDDKCLSPTDDSSCGATTDSPGVVCTDMTGHCDPDTKICRLCKYGYVQCGKTDDTGKFIGNCIDPSRDGEYCGVSIDCEVTDKNICINGMQCDNGKCKCLEGYAGCGSHGECVSLNDSDVWNRHCGATDRGRCDQPEKQSSTDPGPDYMGIRCGANQMCTEKGECVCNGVWCNDQCVIYFDVDINNCGACGNGHVLFGTKAGNLTGDCTVIDKERATCNNGKCACEEGFEIVKVRGTDNKFACIDPNTDADYCGPGRIQCDGKCEDGTCKPLVCDSPLVNCKGKCVSLDDLNMSRCMECKPGYCEHSNQDITLTNGCLEIGTNDNQNCGTCGNVCPPNTNCENEECKPNDGYLLCSGQVYNKSELKLKTCNSCADGFEDMDNNYLNGCELNLMTNKYNCGKLGYDCTEHLLNVVLDTISCEDGLCTYTVCNDISHYVDCNNDNASNSNAGRDGCETDITTSSNCARCNDLWCDGLCEGGECCYNNYSDIYRDADQIKCCSGQSRYHYNHNIWRLCYKDSRYGCFDPEHADDLTSCWEKDE